MCTGEAHARRGNLKEGIELLNKALAIAPRESYVLALAAACLFDLGLINEAKEYLTRAREVDPQNEMVISVSEIVRDTETNDNATGH